MREPDVIENAYILRLKPSADAKSTMGLLMKFVQDFATVKVVEETPRALTIECAPAVRTRLIEGLPSYAILETYADLDLLDR